jgi:hypothetical protein
MGSPSRYALDYDRAIWDGAQGQMSQGGCGKVCLCEWDGAA